MSRSRLPGLLWRRGGPLTILLVLALTGWLAGLTLGHNVQGNGATPTPTKTPTPVVGGLRAPGFAFVPLARAPLPTPTPIPTPTPTPIPTIAPTPLPAEAKPPLWAEAAARAEGLDPVGSYIVVDQNNQQMAVIVGGRLLRLLHVTTGDPRYGWETPAWSGVIGPYWGTFRGRGGVMADDGWWLFAGPGGNFLIHSLPYTLGPDGRKHYLGADELGAMPASNGCIRLAPDDAAWFTALDPEGMPIIILPYTGLRGAQG